MADKGSVGLRLGAEVRGQNLLRWSSQYWEKGVRLQRVRYRGALQGCVIMPDGQ